MIRKRTSLQSISIFTSNTMAGFFCLLRYIPGLYPALRFESQVGPLLLFIFGIAAIPAYFLSTLWANIPGWLYGAVIIAAFLQITGWYYFIKLIRENLSQLRVSFSRLVLLLFLAVGLALTLKLILQLGSTVPAISKLAYSFRPL